MDDGKSDNSLYSLVDKAVDTAEAWIDKLQGSKEDARGEEGAAGGEGGAAGGEGGAQKQKEKVEALPRVMEVFNQSNIGFKEVTQDGKIMLANDDSDEEEENAAAADAKFDAQTRNKARSFTVPPPRRRASTRPR